MLLACAEKHFSVREEMGREVGGQDGSWPRVLSITGWSNLLWVPRGPEDEQK